MYSLNLCRPAVVQQQNSNQVPHKVIVQGLRDALYKAISEIKSLKEQNAALKEENTALKEQVGLQEDRQTDVSQLQEKLSQKENILSRVTKKRRSRTKAYVETLDLLEHKEKELKLCDQQWKRACDALEVSLREELSQKEESWRKKEQEIEREMGLFCHMVFTKEKKWKKMMSQADEEKKILICQIDQLQVHCLS